MTQPLEAVERALLSQSPDLIYQSLCGEPEKCVARVRRIVLCTSLIGPDARQHVTNSKPWMVFCLMYPADSATILDEALKGVIPEGIL